MAARRFSPDELGGDLTDTRRRTNFADYPELGAIDQAVRIGKLSVVECVEELRPDFQGHALMYPSVFVECDVPVVKSRPVKETAWRGPEAPECRHTETRLGHPEMAVVAGVASVYELPGEVRHVDP